MAIEISFTLFVNVFLIRGLIMATTRNIRACWFSCISCPHLYYDGNASCLPFFFFD